MAFFQFQGAKFGVCDSRMKMSSPITFIAHGSSLSEANHFLLELIRQLFPTGSVNIGFLECGYPSIVEALQTHIGHRAETIRVIPLFLVPGNHMTRDIPKIVKETADQNPHVEIILEDFIGNRKEFGELLLKLS